MLSLCLIRDILTLHHTGSNGLLKKWRTTNLSDTIEYFPNKDMIHFLFVFVEITPTVASLKLSVLFTQNNRQMRYDF